ncbi:Amino acid/polyamine transporter I [Penicillium robsamsonii]|uniref:Amino acid/polyamine transporter I n=1 Tax=Penicillium robsamsonii TaxID=1792511 RepID=UPI0025480FCA|nr:Amino acid/polyamine transporter I [Penicillium robsamsonii]KAJ5817033.1 Amino acid/polyamine transporter I [Penicillium robsamsonii]
MRRHHFNSIGTYVAAWRAHVIICEELELGISWYAATKLRIHELKEVMPDLCDFIDYQIRQRRPTSGSMTYEEFNDLVDGILDTLYQGDQASF